MVRITQLKRI